jgi:transposase
MDGDRITMSQRERDRLRMMDPVMKGQRTQREAGRLLGVTERTIRRWQRRLEREGDGGIVHRLRGRASNRQADAAYRRQVVEAYREELSGFGPTFAGEKLAERGLAVAVRTLREWLLAEGLWQQQRKRDRHRSRRARRECFGELVQADGSQHDWLEGRGEGMVLLVMIDDATSKVVARFFPAETTEAYMDLLRRYLRKHGRMVAIYADHDSVFFARDAQGEPVLTQFGRALQELGIELIPAGSPQAKGRVERFNGTAQDRLVKELRLAKAATLEAANGVLEKTFLAWFNRRCTVQAASPNDAHRPLHPAMNLGAILSIQEHRRVSNDYTIRLDNRVYQIPPPAWPGLRGGQVTVERRLDGALRIRFKGQYLKYKALPLPAPLGALPPDPRSLPPGGIPAEGEKPKGCPGEPGQPSAVHPVVGRSGRTPAEPCPPNGTEQAIRKQPWRPPPEHPWRKFTLRRRTNRTVLIA